VQDLKAFDEVDGFLPTTAVITSSDASLDVTIDQPLPFSTEGYTVCRVQKVSKQICLLLFCSSCHVLLSSHVSYLSTQVHKVERIAVSVCKAHVLQRPCNNSTQAL
jgi:hypothetical protein